MTMTQLTDITWNNLWDVMRLELEDSQKGFLHPVTTYLSMAYVNLKNLIIPMPALLSVKMD